MTTHDPVKHLHHLRETLSQDKKPIGFLLSAGCPLSVSLPDGEWPLIPDIKALTVWLTSELGSPDKDTPNHYDNFLVELKKAEKNEENIEDILSFVRNMKEVARGGDVRGFSFDCLVELEKSICQKIVRRLDVKLPDKSTPYHTLASWV